jgi:hypothetical protein
MNEAYDDFCQEAEDMKNVFSCWAGCLTVEETAQETGLNIVEVTRLYKEHNEGFCLAVMQEP